MGAGVTGGKTKMDLANEGSARAVELLGESDVISVYAVDSTPHEMVRPTKVGPNRASIINRVRRIQSSGGGIFVYNGLEAGWNALQVSQVGQRHLILFSDAADSEQPHQYKKLLKDMAAGGATVSVIGLGTDKDPDAPFLKDVAARGGGRIFFTTDASTLPNLFAMETVSVARSTFIAEPVATKATGAWFELSERELDWLPTVDGYNLSYLREGCSAPLLTTDEYKAPLVATGQRGIGRAAAISFAMGGEYSEGIRAWDGFGDFVQTLNRWLMGEELPEGIGIRPSLDGTTMKIDLVYDEELWAEKFAINPPRIILAEGRESPEMRNLVWERIRPGQFSASADLEPGKMVRGAIQVGSTALPFGPIVVGSDAEWTFEPRRRAEIRELAVETGGRELLDLKEAWVKPPRESYASFQPWLFTAFLLFTLLDALATRLGWVWPNLAFLKRRPVPAGELVPASKGASAPAKKEKTAERFRKAKKPSKGYQTVGRTEAAPAEAEATPPPAKKAASKKKATPPKEDDGASRRDRFKRAKKGR